ncbi:hypothetical protein [Scleromatobacter humisilvae]|uniref:Uncharacterized protein n=1 Tax=Scleromatobacter humisilvae TaxID=2897159 RepID=A0A9X2C1Y5_9BURK|nr:hypothetical protein [Scleromatobacter humisilvae]MCK9686239.1 hypothetical protein [Scleromatobacter humisilvae]
MTITLTGLVFTAAAVDGAAATSNETAAAMAATTRREEEDWRDKGVPVGGIPLIVRARQPRATSSFTSTFDCTPLIGYAHCALTSRFK